VRIWTAGVMTTLMRNGRDRRSGKPVKGHAILERALLVGTRSADHIRASGHSGCIATGRASTRKNRPDTWLHPNASQIGQIPLAPRAPSIHGPLRQFAVTQQFRRFRSEADIERAAKLACDAGWLRASRSARSPALSTAGTMRFGNQPHRRGVCTGALRLTGLFPV
jgi:hypothetical protein